MIYFITFLELTLAIDINAFDDQLGRAYKKAKTRGHPLQETDFGYFDKSLVKKGVIIAYHNNTKKKKIRLLMYPSQLIGNGNGKLSGVWEPTSSNISRLRDNLESLVEEYFDSDYQINDFKLSRIDIAADIDVGSRERVSDYIKILHNLGHVKLFSPIKHSKYEGMSKVNFFGLMGNSNGIEFRAYGLNDKKGILRVEVSLLKSTTIKVYLKETNTSKLIRDIAENSISIFMDVFKYIIPTGDHYKKGKAGDLIRERVSDTRMRGRMLRLLTLIPEKKSLLLAQKALNVRNILDVMDKFEDIGVSPITISKRHDVKHLKSLYDYL